MSISSKKMRNLPIKGRSTWFIILINVLGALVRPKGMTNHSYGPSFVLKAVFHSSPSRIRVWCYPLRKSIFVKISAPAIISSMCIGKLYLMVILSMARLWTHILELPSFYGVTIAGTTGRTKALLCDRFYSSLSTWLFSSMFQSDSSYNGVN